MYSNPFLLFGYTAPELFCSRGDETSSLLENIEYKHNTSLSSQRRMGKSALIQHTFVILSKTKKIIPLYIDMLGIQSLKEFTDKLGTMILRSISKNENALDKHLRSLSTFRPLSYTDAISKKLSISFNIQGKEEILNTLTSLFVILSERKETFVLALDSFQQIGNLIEKDAPDLIGKLLRDTSNLCLIYSGNKHFIEALNKGKQNPYATASKIYLNPIEKEKYSAFIRAHFNKDWKSVSDEALELIFNYTDQHTYYVQQLCNRLYKEFKDVSAENVTETLKSILFENEAIYSNYIGLLTSMQYRALRAIAIDGYVDTPTAYDFLNKYNLGAASSVSQAVKSLSEKEFICEENGGFVLQDKFLREWIRIKTS